VKNKNKGLLSDYFSTLGLTITNPMTIVSFTAVFAGVGISNTSGNYLSAALLVLGVFIGSNLWWIILSNGMGILRKKTNDNTLKWVNRISGIIIVVFALILVVSLVR
jgi:threonine/homoserine/homoserine lactone efflux protein